MARKRILFACGSGICTATTVRHKIEEVLDKNGYAGSYELVQCKVTQAAALSSDFDFIISTTPPIPGLACPYVSGIPFLTGRGQDRAVADVLRMMGE
jgi:PTS system galactitol-specific IIB component